MPSVFIIGRMIESGFSKVMKRDGLGSAHLGQNSTRERRRAATGLTRIATRKAKGIQRLLLMFTCWMRGVYVTM